MSEAEEEARKRLLFHLAMDAGFWFGLVVGDDPRPVGRLRESAKTWCADHAVPFHEHRPEPDALVGLAYTLAKGAATGMHWIRTDGPGADIAGWTKAAGELFLAMNERREAYRKRLAGVVVVEGREILKRTLRELAPDLFSIRSFILEPGAEVTTVSLEAMATAMMPTADTDAELERAARLDEVPSLAAHKARLDALLQASVGLLAEHRLDEAVRVIGEQAALLEPLRRVSPGDAWLQRAELSLWRVQSWLARDSGHLVAAQDLQEKALKFANERANLDPHDVAWKQQLADVYADLGALAEGRRDFGVAEGRFRQAAQLSTASGDPHASAMFTIRAGLDALRLRELETAESLAREGMKTFLSLNDKWGEALTYELHGMIAEARGDLAQALEWIVPAAIISREVRGADKGTAPHQLAKLTGVLGMEALEAVWKRHTGGPLPEEVRSEVQEQMAAQQKRDESAG